MIVKKLLSISTIREQFPALVSHPEVIYFDNAATTQKPQAVLDAVLAYHHQFCANPHRATHNWATKSTLEVEKVRSQIKKFIGTSSGKIFFTSGATHASELLADTFLNSVLSDSTTIISGAEDHDSLGKKWSTIAQKYQKKCTFAQIQTNQEGFYSLSSFERCIDSINQETKNSTKTNKSQKPSATVLLTHVHNVFGIEMGIEEIRKKTPSTIPIILDASQSAGHMPISVDEIGVDALYFSGHKLFSFSGIGVLWVSDKYAHHFSNIEAGTLNVEGIISLGAAISFIESVGIKNIEHYLLELTQYSIQKLRNIPGIEFLPGPAYCRCASGHGIVSFRKEGISSNEIADWLNSHGIFTRAGNHCATSSLTEDSVRISMQIYNTKEEIDILCEFLRKI